ncbi:MAG: hypothetical protein ABL866_04510 [Devosia sp.]
MPTEPKDTSALSAAFHDRGLKAVFGAIGTDPIPIKFKGFPGDAHVAELGSPTAKRLAQYRLLQHDLDEAEQALQAIRSLRMLTIAPDASADFRAMLRAMCAAFTVIYGRCFKSVDAGGDRLVANEVFKDPVALREHEFILTLRSKHFAHDVNDYRQAKVAAVFDASGALIGFPAFETFADRSDVIENNGPLLVAEARRYLTIQLERLQQQLMQEVEAMSPADRLALPPMTYQPADHRTPARSRGGKTRANGK